MSGAPLIYIFIPFIRESWGKRVLSNHESTPLWSVSLLRSHHISAPHISGAKAGQSNPQRSNLRRLPFSSIPDRISPTSPISTVTGEFFTMSDNVGLSTPRGSGTSGYVQRNLAHMKPRDMVAPYPKDHDSLRHRQRQPDKGILEHDRKREVEVKVFELRDQLEDEG